MKYNHRKSGLLLAVLAMAIGLSLQSCKDQPDEFELTDGRPTINYIRPAELSASDSLLVQAYPQAYICIVGNNLTSIQQMYFNDKKAILNTSFITDQTLIVQVPSAIPDVVSDKIYLITGSHDTLTYDFHVVIPAPNVAQMSCEYAKPGSIATIYGSYFVDDPNVPLTVTFPDGKTAEIKSINDSRSAITIVVPECTTEGQITVESIYGTSMSKFYYHDSRGLITNFDGATDVVPQGWNIAATYSDVDGVDGNYVQVGPAETEGGWVEELKLPFWCGNWNGDPMSITSGPGIPLRNFLDFSDWQNMSFKMELYIPKSNPWSAGAMQILFVNNLQCANDSWQNNTYIHTSADGGLDLPRALYRPWEATGSFDTGDEWITVTIPLADFVYNDDGTKVSSTMSESSFDSFIIWPINGGVKGTVCTPIFRYDNIRVVPNL